MVTTRSSKLTKPTESKQNTGAVKQTLDLRRLSQVWLVRTRLHFDVSRGPVCLMCGEHQGMAVVTAPSYITPFTSQCPSTIIPLSASFFHDDHNHHFFLHSLQSLSFSSLSIFIQDGTTTNFTLKPSVLTSTNFSSLYFITFFFTY